MGDDAAKLAQLNSTSTTKPLARTSATANGSPKTKKNPPYSFAPRNANSSSSRRTASANKPHHDPLTNRSEWDIASRCNDVANTGSNQATSMSGGSTSSTTHHVSAWVARVPLQLEASAVVLCHPGISMLRARHERIWSDRRPHKCVGLQRPHTGERCDIDSVGAGTRALCGRRTRLWFVVGLEDCTVAPRSSTGGVWHVGAICRSVAKAVWTSGTVAKTVWQVFGCDGVR